MTVFGNDESKAALGGLRPGSISCSQGALATESVRFCVGRTGAHALHGCSGSEMGAGESVVRSGSEWTLDSAVPVVFGGRFADRVESRWEARGPRIGRAASLWPEGSDR